MASSGNFAVFNPLSKVGSITFSEGNTIAKHGNNKENTRHGTTFNIPNTGKWYFECKFVNCVTNGSQSVMFTLHDIATEPVFSSKNFLTQAGNFISFYNWENRIYVSNSYTAYTSNIATQSSGIVSCAIDRDNSHMWVAVNNTWINGTPDFSDGTNKVASPSASLEYGLAWSGDGGGSSQFWTANFGQDSTFAGTETAQGNQDDNGFGDFYYSPPSGYLALCSANLPISDDIDPAQTDDNFPQKQFNAILYTGNSSTNAITGLGFQPDLVWFKRRDYTGSFNQGIIDSSRGVSVGMYPDRTDVDTSFTSDFNSFDSDGFTLKAGSSANINNSGSSFVAWCWRCAGGTTSSNSDGALTSTVQVNQEAGFSMSLYTCNGSGSSFGHGLGATPDYFMIKKRDNQARNWMGWHKDLTTPTTGYIRWNLSNAQGNDTLWDSTAHDSTKIYVNQGTTEVNSPSGDSYICYAWRSVEGYSKFGSYEGNGNSDGPFIYTGFRPRLLFLKSTETADDWIVIDTARSTFNVTNRSVSYNTQDAEVTSNRELDIFSNGFKPGTSNTNLNKSGTKYIYGCWGDLPFKYNNTF